MWIKEYERESEAIKLFTRKVAETAVEIITITFDELALCFEGRQLGKVNL